MTVSLKHVLQFDSPDAHFPWITKVQLVMLLLLLWLSEIILFQFFLSYDSKNGLF